MVIEQLLKEWIAERSAASDLAVAARTAKAIAAEIEGYYQDIVARSDAVALEKSQLLGEKERSLDKVLEVIARLEGQLAQARDRAERLLAEKDEILASRDRTIEQQVQNAARLEAQFSAVRERLEARIQLLDKEVAERARSLASREESIAKLEREIEDKMRTIETYRDKFGVIINALG
jgi:regulator of sigma D